MTRRVVGGFPKPREAYRGTSESLGGGVARLRGKVSRRGRARKSVEERGRAQKSAEERGRARKSAEESAGAVAWKRPRGIA